MNESPISTPSIYCPDNDRIIVNAPPEENFLSGTYTIAHKSSVGVKYINKESNIKITYSTKVNNIVGGHWRWSNNTPPYTLYYANPSKIACIPKFDWTDLSQDTFTGSIVNDHDVTYEVYQPSQVPGEIFDVYQKCSTYDVYQRCIISPIVTPTVTVTLPVQTPIPTPSPTPTTEPIYVTIPVAPSGIIRNELTEHMWVKAVPTITFSSRVSVDKQFTPKKITLHGLSMNHTDSIYITGDQDVFSETLQQVDMFSHVPSLSADFPGFYGLPVDYIIKDENTVDVFINGVVQPGEVDVVIVNRAGYSGLSPAYTTAEWTDYNLQNRLINIK